MDKHILITGGTGLLGSRLTEMLRQKGYKVSYLSRSPGKVKDIEAFVWDVEQQTMDPRALEGVSCIIHLAGAGVAEKRWTKERKKEILQSRTRSAALIKETLRSHPHQVKTFISASGINYYGYDSGGVWKKEESRFGDDFLATVTKAWEEEADLIGELGLRVVKFRIGMVLSSRGGALEKMAKPAKMGLAAPLGHGDQYISWIHIDDLCRMFIFAMENDEISGPFNAVAPDPVTNKVFTKALAQALHKPCFLPAVPGFLLRLALGQLASVVLGGSRVSSEKIESQGFQFEYADINKTLADLLSK